MRVDIYIEDEIKNIHDLEKCICFSVNLFIKDRNLFLRLAEEAKEEIFKDGVGEYFEMGLSKVYCKIDEIEILENAALKCKNVYNEYRNKRKEIINELVDLGISNIEFNINGDITFFVDTMENLRKLGKLFGKPEVGSFFIASLGGRWVTFTY